jgi:hypothetical protein
VKKIILSIITAISLNAVTISGIGYGDNQIEKKKNALSDLSNSISIQVNSNLKTITKKIGTTYKKDIIKVVQLKSSLPIKSAKFINNGETLKAYISTQDSLNAYKLELNRLKKEIEKSYKIIKTTKDDGLKYQLCNDILKYMQEFNSHKIVATMLGGKDLATISIDETMIKNILYKLETKVNTLRAAAKILSHKITQENIYIVPIKTNISNEVTQFAKIFKTKLMQKLDATDNPKDAKYILRGTYDILENEIFVSIKLLDKNNKIVNSANILLDKQAYSKYKYKPKTINIDTAINSANVATGDLKVQLALKGYNSVDGIDLNDGDIINIYAQSNKDICYFLQGITTTKDKTYTYLIERENGDFVSYISHGDVNHPVPILTDVEVSYPFGVEKLMMFAQTLDNGRCKIPVPNCKVDPQTELCLITEQKTTKKATPQKAITQTRSLFSKFHKKNHTKRKLQSAEASISFTSFK